MPLFIPSRNIHPSAGAPLPDGEERGADML